MKVGALIGRFNFLHNGHYNLIKWSLEQVDLLVICLGSHAIAPDSRNPFSTAERAEHIKACFPDANIVFEFIHDHPDDTRDWVSEVVLKVEQHAVTADSITLFGHAKEDTGWYMELFRQAEWTLANYDVDDHLCGTDVRKIAYTGEDLGEDHIPEELFTIFADWLKSPAGKTRAAEYLKEEEYKKPYENLPYPPIHHTVDALVTCQGHILLVKRGKLRGKGLFALPGGFLESRERLFDGAIRELVEETAINVSKEDIAKSWTGDTFTLDNPNRSLIGRIVSEVFHFNLPHDICGGELPKVVGSDDAEAAFWLPVEKLRGDYYKDMDVIRPQFFEDHLYAIKKMLSDIEAMR